MFLNLEKRMSDSINDSKTNKVHNREALFSLMTSLEYEPETKLVSLSLHTKLGKRILHYSIESNVIEIFHLLAKYSSKLGDKVFCRLVNLNYLGEVKVLIILGEQDEAGNDIVHCQAIIKQIGFYTLLPSADVFVKFRETYLSNVPEEIINTATLNLVYNRPVMYLMEKGKPVYYGLNDLGNIEVQINLE